MIYFLDGGEAREMGDGVVVLTQKSDKKAHSVVVTLEDLKRLVAALER